VLSGHADTVPFDAPLWQHDPLKLSEDGGRFYGLGTADMKSFLGIAIEAARGLSAADLKQPLIILATADEESAMHGARALVEAGRPLGRYAVIGEPTGLRPVRMHKGVMGEAVRLTGRSGHASDPRLGNNALEGMHEVLTEVLAWRDELQRAYNNPAFPVSLADHQPGAHPRRRQPEPHLRPMRAAPGPARAARARPGRLRAELSRRVAEVADRAAWAGKWRRCSQASRRRRPRPARPSCAPPRP
jgi:acetylornithine deacetylase